MLIFAKQIIFLTLQAYVHLLTAGSVLNKDYFFSTIKTTSRCYFVRVEKRIMPEKTREILTQDKMSNIKNIQIWKLKETVGVVFVC